MDSFFECSLLERRIFASPHIFKRCSSCQHIIQKQRRQSEHILDMTMMMKVSLALVAAATSSSTHAFHVARTNSYPTKLRVGYLDQLPQANSPTQYTSQSENLGSTGIIAEGCNPYTDDWYVPNANVKPT